MTVLIDTSVLARLANTKDALHGVASGAIAKLHRQGDSLAVTAQVLVEFRNVATRPTNVNGLGHTAAQSEAKAAAFELQFSLLPETPDIFPAWKTIVDALGVIGKQVHDARLVAVCHVHSVSQLLTFNLSHFVRLATVPPGVIILDPAKV